MNPERDLRGGRVIATFEAVDHTHLMIEKGDNVYTVVLLNDEDVQDQSESGSHSSSVSAED